MRILVVTQHYWPEPLNSTDICEGLAARGHEVTVLCGQPNYPQGSFYPGYNGCHTSEEWRHGVRILRSPVHPRKSGVVHRVWNYYSFAAQATNLQAELPADAFDVVFVYQTSPVLMARPALAFARRTGTPVLLYCLDIWPECLTAGGIKPGSPVYEHFRRVSHDIYQQADLLAVTSPLFEDYLREVVDVRFDHLVNLPHFAPPAFLQEEQAPFEGFDRTRCNLTFAGNVGAAQSVQTIVRAAALLRDDERFAFHVLGDGSELERCKRLADELSATNITFWGRHPQESMPSFYAASDAMLITFARNRLLAYTMPLKLHTYLAGGRPVLGSVDGDARRVIEEAACGFCAPAEDAEGLAEVCQRFAACDDKVSLGKNARRYYEDNFTMERFFTTLEEALGALRGIRHGC